MLSRAATTPTFARDRERRGREMETGLRVDVLVAGPLIDEPDRTGRRGNSIIYCYEWIDREVALVGR